MTYEEDLMSRIAWFYYINNMTQQEISDQLGLSRMKVIKLLDAARSQGIVQLKIRANTEKRINVEKELLKKYNLKDTFVVPASKTNLNESIAKAAAQYIESNLTPNCYINVGYGDTISRTISNLIYSLDSNVSLVSLSGGVSYYTTSIISGTHKSDANTATPNIYIIPSPLFASTSEMAKAITDEDAIKEIMSMTSLAYMSVVGIGAVSETATIFKDNKISRNDLVLLKMNGAVGDILSQFYDKDGKKIDCDLHKRLISTDLEVLRKLNNVIGVAGGPGKIQTIHAALVGGYLDVLITDDETAEGLLNFDNQ